MAEVFYITETNQGWRLKKAGGTKVLRVFANREEAVVHAQSLISRQKAICSLQNRLGQWQKI